MARAVAQQGAMGVVSGTALDSILLRRLQQGDPGGHMRRGLAAFPEPEIAREILEEYFRPEGTEDFHRFALAPMAAVNAEGTLQLDLERLLVVANFVEIFLAKEGHSGAIGINFLEKIQMPNPASIYGAMLAGVDYILMGAGIPLEIPGLLDAYARGESGSITLVVEGSERGDVTTLGFDPARVLSSPPRSMTRPRFLAIVSSNVLAKTMVARASGKVDGIIVEDYTAGGHNAPPRGELHLTDEGEPVFGAKDLVDTERMKDLNVPFWLGGSRSFPDSLSISRAAGAVGTQVGTLFAFCRESGFLSDLKRRFLELVEAGKVRVFTHPEASPTGYPLKMALVEGTMSDETEFSSRKRVCNIGLLRRIYRDENGKLAYRCPAESVEQYVRKGGSEQEARNARCLCNGLLSAIGLAMEYAGGYLERPFLVPGECLDSLRTLIRNVGLDYTAADVIRFLDT